MTQHAPHPPVQTQARQPSNGLGTTGFVLGLVGLVFSPVPFIGVVAWPLVILGAVFSAIGLFRALNGKATNKALSIAGLVLSVLGLAVCVIWAVAFKQAVDEVDAEINRVAKVHYEVTGDAKDVDILYGEILEPVSETAPELPWEKDVENKGVFKGGTLSVTTGEAGGSVTCVITVDGTEVDTKTASGPFATADCLGE
ncbi:hypothetical protein SAMN05421630_1011335 [Prauserella marina]|uniref:Uncharacterized protein n=1 Tax=Prauserella marina TaxID=530584 RepID=A0A1G6KQ84_9PSEU|nr:DUF4190 domain-containing protein [Prauserella marina]PWV83985.1 hypothetical protein DES30_1012 [Prauserella marina]SDC33123.1 hypothetical protein SAMN05421630_1011335 [Prauserella marina]